MNVPRYTIDPPPTTNVLPAPPRPLAVGPLDQTQSWSPFSPSIQAIRGGNRRDKRLIGTVCAEIACIVLVLAGMARWRPAAPEIAVSPTENAALPGVARAVETPPPVPLYTLPRIAPATPLTSPASAAGTIVYRPVESHTYYVAPSVPIPDTRSPFSP